MSDRARMLEICRSKLWFESEAEAIKASKRIRAESGKKLEYYPCAVCRLYHLTSKFKQEVNSLNWDRELQYEVNPPMKRKAKVI